MVDHSQDKQFKPVRLKDIAVRAGVSRIAVSKVMLGTGGDQVRVGKETRKRILEIADTMDYRPNRAARTLVGGRSGIIGVLIDSQAPSLFFEYLGHIESIAKEQGYRTMIAGQHNSVGGIKEHVLDFNTYGVEGIISMAHDYPGFRDEIVEIMKIISHVVFINNPKLAGASFVEVDIGSGICEMVGYLASLGRRKIGLVLSSLSVVNVMARHRGYRSGLDKAGIAYRESLVWVDEKIQNVIDYDLTGFLQSVVIKQGADAVIAINDLVAAAIINGLNKIGLKVPQDVAVVGVDDMSFGRYFIPPITTVRQPADQVAAAAVDLLDGMISGRKEIDRQRQIKPEILLRGSA